MLKFEAPSTLIAEKMEDATVPRADLLTDQKRSYNNYRDTVVVREMEFLSSALQTQAGIAGVKIKARVGSLTTDGYKREIKKLLPKYYPVTVDFTVNGYTFKDVEILRIPFMDSDGVININGERRVMLMQLASAPDITYSKKNNTVSVALDERNIGILIGKKAVDIKVGKTNKINLYMLIKAMAFMAGMEDNLSEIISNAFIKSDCIEGALPEICLGEVNKLRLIETYSKKEYSLSSEARRSINSALSIDRCLDKILTRPVLNYAAGTHVTADMLKEFKRNMVNSVYVRAIPLVTGYWLENDWNLTGDIDNPIIIKSDHPLMQEEIKFLYDMGAQEITCKRKRDGEAYVFHFEQEIIGNYTCTKAELSGEGDDSVSADTYIYYYENPTHEVTNQHILNVHDFIAIYSLIGYLKAFPEERVLPDRDEDFLKRVRLIGDIFSEAFEKVSNNFCRNFKRSLQEAFRADSRKGVTNEVFRGFSKAWTTYMWDNKYMQLADTINPMATLAQVNHVVTSAKMIPEEVRMLSMGYYGRICPYETPAGQKLGAVSTKAINSRIQPATGIMLAPYQKVAKNSEGKIVRLSPNVEWFTVQQETQYVIGDRLSLVRDTKGRGYLNSRVIARVPDGKGGVTLEVVNANRLEYVNAYAEQHLSPSASLIPFACCNDAMRVTYATNMLKQSILVEASEKPRVYTSMYKEAFENSNTYVIRAKQDGVVDSIRPGELELSYDNTADVENIPISETIVNGKSVNFMKFNCKEGDHFCRGDIIAESSIAKDGIYSPGVNVIVAYMQTGWNYEDAIHESESCANKFTSISAETVKKSIKGSSAEYSITAGTENYYRYIPEDGVLGHIKRTTREDSRIGTGEPITAEKASGILYSIDRISNERNLVEYRYQLLAFNRLKVGDKMSGRHSNKGTDSIIEPDSKMPMFKNGQHVEMILNPCGVPSRMNIGQNFEAFLGFIGMLLDINIQSNAFNGASYDEVCYLMHYVYDLANTADVESVIRSYSVIPEGLHKRARERHPQIREWEGCFNKDGTANLWNPETGKYFESPVTFGVAYMLKLEHEVNHKIHVRSGYIEEAYSMISKQPTRGAAQGGGQKMGEMELWAYMAYGANGELEEILNEASDNIEAKTNQTVMAIGKPEEVIEGPNFPHSLYVLNYYMEAMGIKMESDRADELPDVSRAASANKKTLNVRVLFEKSDPDNFNMKEALLEMTKRST